MINAALPWTQISKPTLQGSINKRRVDANLKKNFWWTRDFNDRVGLLIELDQKINNKKILNEFEQFEVVLDTAKNSLSIIYSSKVSDTIEVFLSLCLDIIDFVENFSKGDIDSLVANLFLRLNDWMYLFKPAVNSFNESKQIGLLGELSFINDTLLQKFSYKEVLNIWRGPIPEPQDFVADKWAVEVKAQRVSSEPIISINSLNQLDIINGPIFISHRKFSDSVNSGELGLTLQSQVEQIIESIGRDNFYHHYFLGLLRSLGYDHYAPYANKKYHLKVSNYYSVSGDFPRLMRSDLSSSIVRASYTVNLTGLDNFKLSNDELFRELKV